MKGIMYSIHVAAIILVLVCLLLPALQWAAIPINPLTAGLTGLTALAFGLCKIAFFPIAKFHFSDKNPQAGGVFLLSGLLFMLLSINSTTLFLKTQLTQRSNHEKKHSTEYKRQLHQINTLEVQIKTVTSLIAADTKAGFRTRAYKQLEKLDQLTAGKQNLLKSLNQSSTPNKTNPDYLKLGKLSSSLIVAVVLHLACILAVMACTEWQPKGTSKTNQKETQKIKGEEIDQEFSKLTPEQAALAKKITEGEYGKNPKLKKLIEDKTITGGYNKIKPVFDYLIKSNVMIRDGNRYLIN